MSIVQTFPLGEEEEKRLRELYTAHRDYGQRYIRTKPGNQILAYTFEKFKDEFYNLKIRQDDVFVFGWPKNGSVWLAEMVWCMRNECNLDEARSILAHNRFPFIDFVFMAEAFKHVLPLEALTNVLDEVGKMKSPRTLRSHLSLDLMPPDMLNKAKVFVIIRNPKDTIVSYYHHEKLLKLFGFTGDFSEYFNNFMDGHVAWGSYWEYTKEVWKRRDHPNMCLLFYEEMKKDITACMKKVAKFLGIELSKAQIELLKDHLSFNNMRENVSVNLESFRGFGFNDIKDGRFIRKGEVGDWKNYFTDDMNDRIDEAIDKHFNGLGLNFTYEL